MPILTAKQNSYTEYALVLICLLGTALLLLNYKLRLCPPYLIFALTSPSRDWNEFIKSALALNSRKFRIYRLLTSGTRGHPQKLLSGFSRWDIRTTRLTGLLVWFGFAKQIQRGLNTSDTSESQVLFDCIILSHMKASLVIPAVGQREGKCGQKWAAKTFVSIA